MPGERSPAAVECSSAPKRHAETEGQKRPHPMVLFAQRVHPEFRTRAATTTRATIYELSRVPPTPMSVRSPRHLQQIEVHAHPNPDGRPFSAGTVHVPRAHTVDDDAIHGEPGVPFNVFLDRDVQTLAVRQQGRTAESGTQTGDVVGLNNDLLVEPRGLEPLTLCLQSRCATNCAKAPWGGDGWA